MCILVNVHNFLFYITDYQVVIICSNDDKDKRSYILDHLRYFHRAIKVEDQVISDYLNHHLTNNKVSEYEKQISASDVDPDKYEEIYFMLI